MNVIKEKEKVDKLNKKLVVQIFAALNLQPEENGDNAYVKIPFEVGYLKETKHLLRKNTVEDAREDYLLILMTQYPYIRFKNYWEEYTYKIGNEDISECKEFKLRWAMFALEYHIKEMEEFFVKASFITGILESLLEKVNAVSKE